MSSQAGPHVIDWQQATESLFERGYAELGSSLEPTACADLIATYASDASFRSRINMAQYRFGRGEYKYFRYPLPPVVADLRRRAYEGLAPAANRWNELLGLDRRYPRDLQSFTRECQQAGQTQATPLLLHYVEGDHNFLHQDVYGEVVFPFQVVVALSAPGRDYEGGELLLVEQRPRAQSFGQVIVPARGHAIAITTRYRPVRGKAGYYRGNVRHGVSPLRRGERYTLGIIFHDAT